MSLYSSLIFDLGNVIVDLDFDRTTNCMTKLFNNEELYSYPGVQEILFKFETGKISEELFINSLIKLAPRNKVQAKDILDCWNAMLLGVGKDKIELIKDLKEHYKIYVFSNTNSAHIRYIENWLKINYGLNDWFESNFDQVFYSHKIGYRKPDPESFRIVLELIPDKKSNILFVDDLEDNVLAARNAGIHSFVYNGSMDLSKWLWAHHVNY